MLDNHPDLAIARETNFVRPLWWQRVRFGDLRDAGEPPPRSPSGSSPRRTAGARACAKGASAAQAAIRRVADAPPTVGSVVQACFALRADANGKPRWGDKRPAYSGFIGSLFAMFPDAQYINVVRDPRGAVASQIPMGWDPPRWRWRPRRRAGRLPIRRAAIRAPSEARPVPRPALRGPGSDPRVTLEQVCDFAALRANDAVETMIGGERGDPSRRPHRRVAIAEPVTTASVERRRERLDPPQARSSTRRHC